LIFVLFSIFYFNETTPFPSLYTLFPTFGALLIIVFAKPNTKVGFILSNKLVVFLGLLSYSAYLIHQPLISFSKIYFEKNFTLLDQIIIFFLTILFAYLSYRYIESPFRIKSKFSRKFIFIYGTTFSAVLIFYSILIFKLIDFPFEKAMAKKLASSSAVISTNMDERKFSLYRIEYLNTKRDILVLGSSRIMQVKSSPILGNLLNLAVSGASIEDQITLGIKALTKFTPKVVYLSADPWLFNENSGQTRYKSINENYNEALNLISEPNSKNYPPRFI